MLKIKGSNGERIVDITPIIHRIIMFHIIALVCVSCDVSLTKYPKIISPIILTKVTITERRSENPKLFKPFFNNPNP
jgi:hypothetical protein